MRLLQRILLSAQEFNERIVRGNGPRARRRRQTFAGLQPVAGIESLEERVLLSASLIDTAAAIAAYQPAVSPPASPVAGQ